MHKILAVLLALSVGIGTGYWYHVARSTCPVPITYQVGFVDPRFAITDDEVRAALADAEALWEDATGEELFAYAPEGTLTVNFLFDERQQEADEEHTLREVLDQKESVSSEIRDEYETLTARYAELKARYEREVAAYENRLAVYHGEVAYWNNRGGAPEDVYTRLQEERVALDAESRALGALTDQLNSIVDEINALGAQSTAHIREYNETVREYNERFTHEREFTQGDYTDNTINIYQFDDQEELRLVLAHEFGHALSLGHVENEQSVMHYLMEGQRADLAITAEDRAEFDAVCGARAGLW